MSGCGGNTSPFVYIMCNSSSRIRNYYLNFNVIITAIAINCAHTRARDLLLRDLKAPVQPTVA